MLVCGPFIFLMPVGRQIMGWSPVKGSQRELVGYADGFGDIRRQCTELLHPYSCYGIVFFNPRLSL
jgi:hypothetical protein